jgi:hypothetical protein
MNERIQELEKQAWEFVDKTWNWANANNPSQATLFKAKFAELIVRECADAADMAQNANCKYAGDYVAEHMGFGEQEGVTKWRMS